nr:regulator of nonsense transcripts 1 homolog [Tanacetum cinerariifolium]
HEVEFQMVHNALLRRFGAPGLRELIASQARILIKLVLLSKVFLETKKFDSGATSKRVMERWWW